MKFIYIFLIVINILNFNLLKADEIKTENEIAKNLRCLICQGQSVHDSDSEFAISLKLVIKDKIQQMILFHPNRILLVQVLYVYMHYP